MNPLPTAVDVLQARPSLSGVRSVILLCPDLHEVGGIGLVSRLALHALQSCGAPSGCRGEVWSYGAPHIEEATLDDTRWRIRYARGRRAAAALWGLKASLGDARHTLVVAMHLHLAPLALPLVQRGGRLAVFLHGIEAWVPLSGLRRRALEQPAVLLANSNHTIQRFKQANPGFTNAPIRACPLGVPDTAPVSPSKSHTEPFALIVGRLSSRERYKGHDMLLEIWREMLKGSPTARLVIVGEGDDRARLEAKARELTVANAVTFLGKVTKEKLESLYRDCSFFVMPSKEEGFGLVFLEAMRAGKACIAGQGAAEEIVVDGLTGLIVPAQERKTLLTAMLRLFRDPELSASMGHAGRERYLVHFTDTHFRNRLMKALQLEALSH